MSESSRPPRPDALDRRHRHVALLVASCFFMEMLDGTIVTTSAPKIAASLDASVSAVGLIVTAYIVTLAALIPVSGWLSARYGARRIFLAAIVTFTVASLGCALSTSLPELVAMRVLQGAGGAMMVPVGRLVVLARTAKADIMRVTAYLIWPALVAPVIAPLAGGLITTALSWHWIFLINVPLGAIAFVAAWRLIASPDQDAPPRLDRLGVVLTCTGLAGLTATSGLLAGRHPDWLAIAVIGGASALLTIAAVRHLLRAPVPLVNLRTLRIRTFAASVGGGSLFLLVVGAGPFLFPLLFQEVFGWSAIKSGTVVLFLFAGNIAIKPATTFLYSRFGFRTMLLGATTGIAATMVAAAFLTGATPLAVIALVALLSGIARSIGGTGYSTIAFSDVPPERLRDANTLQATAQQLSLGFGVAVAAVFLRAGEPLGKLLPGDATAGDAYTIAFLLLAVVALGAAVAALRLEVGAGDVLRRPGARAAQRPAAVARDG